MAGELMILQPRGVITRQSVNWHFAKNYDNIQPRYSAGLFISDF
jgi:hypothetical protein